MASDSGLKPKRLAGREEANVDGKGRVLFSKRKREILGDDFVMRLGDDGCICVYSEAEWEAVTAEMDGYPKTRGRRSGRRMSTRGIGKTRWDTEQSGSPFSTVPAAECVENREAFRR